MKKSYISIFIIFLILNTFKILYTTYIFTSIPTDKIVNKFFLTLSLTLCFFLISFLFKKKYLFIILYIIQYFYLLVNLNYYLFFNEYFHLFQSLTLFKEATGVALNPLYFIDKQVLPLIIDFPIFIILFLKFNSIKDFINNKKYLNKIKISALSLLLIFSTITYQDEPITNLIEKSTFTGEAKWILFYGTLANSIVSFQYVKDEIKLIKKINYGRFHKKNTTIQNKANIVFIQVESLDSKALFIKNNDQFLMPKLRKLALNNIYYPFMIAHHKAGGSSDAEFAIINSVEPFREFPSVKLSAYRFTNAFTRYFSSNNFKTLAFHGNTGYFYNRNLNFLKMGYDKFIDRVNMNTPVITWGSGDHDVYNYVYDKIKEHEENQEKYFHYLITLTSHTPFNYYLDFTNTIKFDNIKNDQTKKYFSSMEYVDNTISKFVEQLTNLPSPPTIFIFADHTPPRVNSKDFTSSYIHYKDTYVEFVPLIIISKNHKSALNDDIAASFLDLSITALNLSIDKYNYLSDGIDLLNLKADLPPIPYYGRKIDRKEMLKELKNKNLIPKNI